MDIALILDKLVPGANYSGSLTANDQPAYFALNWQDNREKPSWQAILDAANDPNLGKTPLEQLKEIFVSLPVTAQAEFGTLASAVFMFLQQNNPDAAKLVIENADVPEDLQGLKVQMLEVFPSE